MSSWTTGAAELIRDGENTLYRLPGEVVARITRIRCGNGALCLRLMSS
ncbi:hypothetical protein [Saccharopolyspora cebuensis]|uniref:Uncharacterized protein n=1 Tax=Saccharopolyspora cebuensis TaxID=418759 RepID=A0ABV4CRL7_9PSEU